MRPAVRPASALTAAAVLLLTACGGTAGSAGAGAQAGAGTTTAAVPAAGEQFGYTGATGPGAWAQLDPEWSACGTGEHQSPIDLGGATPAAQSELGVSYVPGTAELVNTGATVRADEAPGSTLTVDGVGYELTQFHLHEPAEHTVDGVRADAELHLVHTAADGSLAVLGVLLTEGAEDVALQPYLDALPGTPGETSAPASVDPAALLPADHATYRYTGSLTTPPCSEDVEWLVLQQPVSASAAQLAGFRAVIGENARPVQETGDRTVTVG